jgi:hypothetical protein
MQLDYNTFATCTCYLCAIPKLGDEVTLFGGRKGTKAAAVIALTSGWADHYSAAAMYLRLNGLVPPTAKPKE